MHALKFKKRDRRILKSIFDHELGTDVPSMIRANILPSAALAAGSGCDGGFLTRGMAMRKSYFKLIAQGCESANGEMLFDLCHLTGHTPDELHPADSLDPAPVAVMEAAMLYIEDLLPQAIPENLIQFLERERVKADRFAALKSDESMPENFEMLLRVQGIVQDYLPDGHLFDFSHDRLDAPSVILMDLNDCVKYVASGNWIPKMPPKWETEEKREAFKKYRRRMYDAMSSFVPGEGHEEWLEAFDKNVDALGFEAARDLLRTDVGVFSPVSRYRTGPLSMTMDDGRYISGAKVIDVLCDSYRISKGISQWFLLQDRHKTNRKAYKAVANNVHDWSIMRETKLFLRAEANRRYISGHIDYEQLIEKPAPAPVMSRRDFITLWVKTYGPSQ